MVRVRVVPTHTGMRLLSLITMVGLCSTAQARVVVTETSIEIYDPIRFVGTTAAIATRSTPMLDSVARMMRDNPSIRVLEIHAFGVDATIDQLVLGELRARAIVAELVRRGIAAKRLRAVGAAHPDHGNDPGAALIIAERSGGC